MNSRTRRPRQAIRRKLATSTALQRERRDRPRSDASKAATVAAMTELVETGLASWRERADGHPELHVLGGGRWLFKADGVMRLA